MNELRVTTYLFGVLKDKGFKFFFIIQKIKK
jgi:hypothetical protein